MGLTVTTQEVTSEERATQDLFPKGQGLGVLLPLRSEALEES
jgi:hypothetical protein